MNKILIYDFDGTLTTDPVPKFAIIEKCGYDGGIRNQKFNNMVQRKIYDDNDGYEAIYLTYLEIIKKSGYPLNDESFSYGSSDINYHIGVYDFLNKTNEMGYSNYLLSSGIKPFLDACSIAKFFKDIYATTFKYDNMGNVEAIDFSMSDKKKVDAIKDICSRNGVDDCRDIIYIGDGLTDYYAMKYVKDNGGKVIFIVNDKYDDVSGMKSVVDIFCDGDYSLDKDIYKFVTE